MNLLETRILEGSMRMIRHVGTLPNNYELRTDRITQLNLQMVAGLAFRFYSEARITFMPTYKYDIGTDQYDSSEKARIPAWTDRILRKGTNLRQLSYNSAALKFSDHRPVYATFECTAHIVNEPLRDKISREVYVRRKAEVGEGTANANTEETDDEDLIGYDAIEPGLPPASSDRQKWWLDNGKLARSTMTAPKAIDASQETILNPNRPHNPFAPTEEPDWVSIPSRSRLSSFSSMSTSPYEHINHSTVLSTSAFSSGQRKLPPAYDPSALPAKLGRLNLDREKNHGREETPPPPPPRKTGTPNQSMPRTQTMPVSEMQRSLRKAVAKPDPPRRRGSTASQASQQSARNKVPPPVAKKPTHLAAASPTIGSPNVPSSETHSTFNGDAKTEPLFPRRSSTAVQSPHSAQRGQSFFDGPRDSNSPRNSTSAFGRELADTPPQLPRRVGTGLTKSDRQSATGSVGLVGLSSSTDGRPKPPPRKPVADTREAIPSRSKAQTDLLGDDLGLEMSGWEALKPSSTS